jgi:hypothetical protein
LGRLIGATTSRHAFASARQPGDPSLAILKQDEYGRYCGEEGAVKLTAVAVANGTTVIP